VSKRNTDLTAGGETAAPPGIAEAPGDLDLIAGLDESEQSPVSYAGLLDRQAMQQSSAARRSLLRWKATSRADRHATLPVRPRHAALWRRDVTVALHR
jgi:hypothetical protein